MNSEVKHMLDINGAEIKEGADIQISRGPLGLSIWVNVDGLCRLRIVGIQPDKFQLEDNRSK